MLLYSATMKAFIALKSPLALVTDLLVNIVGGMEGIVPVALVLGTLAQIRMTVVLY